MGVLEIFIVAGGCIGLLRVALRRNLGKGAAIAHEASPESDDSSEIPIHRSLPVVAVPLATAAVVHARYKVVE